MIAETISLGILSLPSVLARIGMAPGIILIVGLGIVATYTGWVIHSSEDELFKTNFPCSGNWRVSQEVPLGELPARAI